MTKHMTLKWESNSRVKSLASINTGDIISRTTTLEFPAETATVRLHRVRDKNPQVTIHFRGKSQSKNRTYWDWNTQTQKIQNWDYANTMRVNFILGGKDFNTNGEMDFSDLPLVENTVNKVREILSGK